MIRIVRMHPPPSTLTSPKIKETMTRIREIVASGEKPKSSDFPSHWGAPDVRRQLWEMQYGKCCYCERTRDVNRESDIEHFRPKAAISERPEGQLGYWWLSYDWKNLFFSCRTCNQEYKKNYFPLANEKNRALKEVHNLDDEEPYLLNPEQDNPEKCIGYDWVSLEEKFVFPTGKDKKKRGEWTIKILGLDRNELGTEKAKLIPTLRAIVEKMNAGRYLGNQLIVEDAKNMIREETSSERRYAGFRREFFRVHGMGEFVTEE